MKQLFQLCFLVLAFSSVSQELLTTQVPAHHNVEKQENSASQRSNETQKMEPNVDQKDLNASMTEQHLNQTQEEATNKSLPTPLTPAPSGPTSQPSSVTTPEGEREETSESGEGHIDDPGSTRTASTSPQTAVAPSGGSSWGYVILVLIIILIIALCVILLMLRRASRTYSFDLQRPAPSSNVYEPTGTFGQVYVDDIDLPVHKDVISDDLSTTPVPNGTSPQLEETAADEENAPQEQPEASDLQNSSSSSSSSLSGDDQAEKKSNKMSSNNLFFDAAEEPQPQQQQQQQQQPQQQQNENNNNPSVCCSGPFVEINLDEPPWSDQLLTSPQPTSSVLPFSSFSFSSSSSSS